MTAQNSKIDSKEHIEPSRAPPSITAASDKGEELFLKWQFFQMAHEKCRTVNKILLYSRLYGCPAIK